MFVFIFSVAVSICFCSVVSIAQNHKKFDTFTYITCSVLGACLLLLCFLISRQPQSENRPTFHVIPVIITSIINLFLFSIYIYITRPCTKRDSFCLENMKARMYAERDDGLWHIWNAAFFALKMFKKLFQSCGIV